MRTRPAVLPGDRPTVEAVLDASRERTGFPPLSEEAEVALTAAVGPVGWLGESGGHPAGFVHVRHHRGDTVAEVAAGASPGEVAAVLVPEAVAAADGPVRVWATDSAAIDAIVAAGGRVTRSLVRLQCSLPAGSPGYDREVRIVPFRRRVDEGAYLVVTNDAFAGHPESGAWTFETFEARAARPWFDPQGLFLAWSRGVPVGAVWTKRHGGGVGEIYSIAVRPRAAGRGLGRRLVLTGFTDLADRSGASTGMLWADEANERAVRLYRRLGMEPVRRRVELVAG